MNGGVLSWKNFSYLLLCLLEQLVERYSLERVVLCLSLLWLSLGVFLLLCRDRRGKDCNAFHLEIELRNPFKNELVLGIGDDLSDFPPLLCLHVDSIGGCCLCWGGKPFGKRWRAESPELPSPESPQLAPHKTPASEEKK